MLIKKNQTRLKSARNFYCTKDSYSLPRYLQSSRARFEPFGLPLSVSVHTGNRQFKKTFYTTFNSKEQSEVVINSPHSASTSSSLAQEPTRSSSGRQDMRIDGADSTYGYSTTANSPLLLLLDQVVQLIHENTSSPANSGPDEKTSSKQGTSSTAGSVQNEAAGTSRNELAGTVNCTFGTEILSRDCSCADLKSYHLISAGGNNFHIHVVEIPFKRPLWVKTMEMVRGGVRLWQDLGSLYLKCIILNERSASLVRVGEDATRVVVVAALGLCSAEQLCSKVLSDIQFTQKMILGHDGVWNILTKFRLRHDIRCCKSLLSNVGETAVAHPKSGAIALKNNEEEESPTKSEEDSKNNNYCPLLNPESLLLPSRNLKETSSRNMSTEVDESTITKCDGINVSEKVCDFKAQPVPTVLRSMLIKCKHFNDRLARKRARRHYHRSQVAPASSRHRVLIQSQETTVNQLIRIFSSPTMPHGLDENEKRQHCSNSKYTK